MASKSNSTIDMLKRLSQELENGIAAPTIKRKSIQTPPSLFPKKIKASTIEKSNASEIKQIKQKTTVVERINLIELQDLEERKKQVIQAKLFLQQAEEEDFEINHPMLHDKYNQIYSFERIEEYARKWKEEFHSKPENKGKKGVCKQRN